MNAALKKNVPMRFNVVYTNLDKVYDITFYHGFKVQVISGPFGGSTP